MDATTANARGVSAQTAAGWALGATAVLAVAKVAAWALTGSLAVLSQALDSVVDIVGLGLVFLAVRLAGKPADASHHYGHAKAENLAAFTQTLLLGVVLAGIALEAVRRLAGGGPPVDAAPFAIALMAASAVVDVFRARLLTKAARRARSDALAAGALNIFGDIATAIVALVSLVLVRLGMPRADAVGALLVASAVAVAGVRLGKRSSDVLMDRAPVAPVEAIAAATTAAPGVTETRRVRVRGGGRQLFADVTVAAGRTASLERAHDIAEGVEQEIARVAPGADVVVHVEPAAETTELVERVQAAATRTDGVREVHNVTVSSLAQDGEPLRVTLHAKTMPGLSLQEAHELSDAIESSVRRELGSGARVDTHIEPLESTAAGHDVTGSRADIVASVMGLAEDEPDVIDCHEVIVTSTGGELSVVAHLRARPDLPLAAIHDASTRIEKAIHNAHEGVGRVVIHFEPA
jgi:cation diffusion facilitator family transporter